MKLANIIPIPLLEKYGNLTNYHIVLSYLVLRNEEYADFYKKCSKRGDYVMLDDSVIELGKPLSIQEQIPLAERIGASEVMCSDYPMDRKRTLEATADDLAKLSKDFPYKIFACAQGKNPKDLLQCYKALLKFDRIDTIGFSFTMNVYWKKAIDRFWWTTFLDQNDLIDRTKEYHLLGTGHDAIEIKLQSKYKWIRGIDSRIAVLNALNNLSVTDQRFVRDFDFFSAEDSPFVQDNINQLKRWCDGQD